MSVSIILPFRNAETTLPACLDSIQQQTLNDFELLAIDDHSQDQSTAIIKRYAAQDSRIRLLNNSDKGLVSALNLGLSKASRPYIARMDADDLMHSQRLQLQKDYLDTHPEISLVGSQARLFPEHLIRTGYLEYMNWQNRVLSAEEVSNNIFIESPFAHPSIMMRHSIFDDVDGYRHGNFPEDYELWLRLNHAGHKMAKLPHILLDWRESETRTSRVDKRYSREAFDQLRAEYLAKEPLLLAHSQHLVIWGAGRKTRQRVQLLFNRGFEPCAWIDVDQKKIGNTIQGAKVQPPTWLNQRPKVFILCYVNNHGIRDKVAAFLSKRGYRCGKDYLQVG